MSPDVRLVAHAPQRDPVELSAQGLGHGSAHARFADPGGAHEAQDGALQAALQLPHGQVLQHPLLQLFHGVVVVVQENPGCSDVQPVCQTSRQRQAEHVALASGRTAYKAGKARKVLFLEKKDVARTDLDPSERVFREPQAWDFYFRRFSSYRNDRHYTLKNSDLLLISSRWLPRHTLCPRTLISTHPLLPKLFLLRCFFSLLPRPALIPENLMISKTKTPQSPITSRPPEHPHLHSSRCHSGSARARARVCVCKPVCCLHACFSKRRLCEAFGFVKCLFASYIVAAFPRQRYFSLTY